MKNTTEKNIKNFPKNGNRPTIRKRNSAAAMLESVFACKWSAQVLKVIGQGINRPGAITNELDGLTTKVMNECLRRLIDFKLIEKTSFPEIPPRVEYNLTDLGWRFVGVLDSLDDLQAEINRQR